MWDSFQLISATLGKTGYGVMIHFTFGCSKKCDTYSRSIHGETAQVIAQSGHRDYVIHFKHFPIL